MYYLFMNIIEAGNRVYFSSFARDWANVGQAYQIVGDSAHVQWNKGYVSTVPLSQLVRW